MSNAFERSKNISWCILYRQLLSRRSLIMLYLSKNVIPLLYINFSKIFENHRRTEILTQDKITCFRILKTRKKHRVAYMRHFSALCKHGDLVFLGRDTFPSCFRVGNERSPFRHIRVITFLFFLIPVTFPVRYFFSFLTHVQDRMINVSDILPLRTNEVNDGLQVMKFEPAPIIRPNFFDPLLMTVLTGFQCN